MVGGTLVGVSGVDDVYVCACRPGLVVAPGLSRRPKGVPPYGCTWPWRSANSVVGAWGVGRVSCGGDAVCVCSCDGGVG